MEYLPFGETLVEEHLNSYNSPYKFNGKELDDETGNYYYGARYYNPKWSIWLSPDPLSAMYPSYSPYAYVMQNPIRYTDPTGMSAENGGCGFGCMLSKLVNSVFHPGEPVNPNTGRLSSRYSRATGEKLERKKPEGGNPSRRTPQLALSSLEQQGIVSSMMDVQVSNNITPPCNCNPPNNNSITINGREIGIVGPTDISFDFGHIGAISSLNDGSNNPNENNRIDPLGRDQKDNLRAVAEYLKANPQATVRFQYPTVPTSAHPNVQGDIRTVFGMSFSHITNYLKAQGVDNLDKRVLRSNGTGFGVFTNN